MHEVQEETVEEDYYVEKVLKHRDTDSGVEYLVKWEGFSHRENTWEPSSHISNTNAYREYKLTTKPVPRVSVSIS